MGVNCVDSRARGVPHKRHANFLQDAGFHQPGVKRVPKIVKAYVADSGVLEGRLPRSLYDSDGASAKVDHEAFYPAVIDQEFE